MKNINTYRKFYRNKCKPNKDGDYVVYWMQINRRFEYNYALEYAVAWANKIGKPLLVYEGLSIDYPWVSDRFHGFIMQGMKENFAIAKKEKINYYSYVEPTLEAGKGLLYNLAENACLIISDEYPVFIVRKHNERVGGRLKIPFITVDSNGIIPLGITNKEPYSAYLFRKDMQKHFLDGYRSAPLKKPLNGLQNREKVQLSQEFLERYPSATESFKDIRKTVSELDIDHSVSMIDLEGTRKVALKIMRDFIKDDLLQYGEKRNHPDEKKTSGLSGWLHYGKISSYEIVDAVLDQQPKDWDIEVLTPNGGKNTGFFRGDPSIESFLDELVTWREVGFHFAHHRNDYDQFDSLPSWSKKTMEEHENDPRQWEYSYEELENSQTHDELWNAAQTQLRETGIIHNYLRMLWGKKVIEWTPNHRTALEFLIELNNKFAIDGRDPNSYSGIFWCFGRFDRAWQEREVFGKLRYMTSDSTRKKVRLKKYLDEYGRQKSIL